MSGLRQPDGEGPLLRPWHGNVCEGLDGTGVGSEEIFLAVSRTEAKTTGPIKPIGPYPSVRLDH